MNDVQIRGGRRRRDVGCARENALGLAGADSDSETVHPPFMLTYLLDVLDEGSTVTAIREGR